MNWKVERSPVVGGYEDFEERLFLAAVQGLCANRWFVEAGLYQGSPAAAITFAADVVKAHREARAKSLSKAEPT